MATEKRLQVMSDNVLEYDYEHEHALMIIFSCSFPCSSYITLITIIMTISISMIMRMTSHLALQYHAMIITIIIVIFVVVVMQNISGQKADIYSVGCTALEMMMTPVRTILMKLFEWRE